MTAPEPSKLPRDLARAEERFVYTDVPRGRYVAVERPGTDPGFAVERNRRQFEQTFCEASPFTGSIAERVTRRRVVFGDDALREKLIIWDFGLDDYVIEALKGDMLDGAGPDLAVAEIRFAERADDMLWFTAVIPSAADLGRFAIPLRSYRHRANDRRCIELDHPHLMSEWLVDIRVRGLRRLLLRRRPPRTGG